MVLFPSFGRGLMDFLLLLGHFDFSFSFFPVALRVQEPFYRNSDHF